MTDRATHGTPEAQRRALEKAEKALFPERRRTTRRLVLLPLLTMILLILRELVVILRSWPCR